MSIIEKALRQAQEPLLKPESPAVRTPQPVEAPAPAPAHSWKTEPAAGPSLPSAPAPSTKTLILVAAVVLASTAALVIGGAVWLKRTFSIRPAASARVPAAVLSPAAAESVASAPPTVSRPAAPARTASRSQPPTLTGVIEGTGAPAYAMLDGEIVQVGQAVGDWTLTEIAGGAVTIRRSDGTQTTLRLPE